MSNTVEWILHCVYSVNVFIIVHTMNNSNKTNIYLYRDNPTALFWELVFTGDQPSLTEKQILDIVYKDLPHYYYKDSEGVVIGDIFFHIKDYATTKLPLDLQILNLTWSDELLNPNSFLFQQYSADLCRDVWKFYNVDWCIIVM